MIYIFLNLWLVRFHRTNFKGVLGLKPQLMFWFYKITMGSIFNLRIGIIFHGTLTNFIWVINIKFIEFCFISIYHEFYLAFKYDFVYGSIIVMFLLSFESIMSYLNEKCVWKKLAQLFICLYIYYWKVSRSIFCEKKAAPFLWFSLYIICNKLCLCVIFYLWYMKFYWGYWLVWKENLYS